MWSLIDITNSHTHTHTRNPSRFVMIRLETLVNIKILKTLLDLYFIFHAHWKIEEINKLPWGRQVGCSKSFKRSLWHSTNMLAISLFSTHPFPFDARFLLPQLSESFLWGRESIHRTAPPEPAFSSWPPWLWRCWYILFVVSFV